MSPVHAEAGEVMEAPATGGTFLSQGGKSDEDSDPRAGEYMEPEAVVSSESGGDSSSTASSEADFDEAAGFPFHAWQKLNNGLNKNSWIVDIPCLLECEKAAAQLIKHPDRAGVRDLEQMRRMLRSTLADAFEKVLTEHAVSGWTNQIQLQIFDAVIGLLDLAVAKLSQLRAGITIDAVQAFEDEADLAAILDCVQQAFDVNSNFNARNQDATVPPRLLRAQTKRYASPQLSELSSPDSDSFSPSMDNSQQQLIYSWPAYFMNYFGHKRGFHYIQQILATPKQNSMELLRQLLMVLSKCVRLGTSTLIQEFQQEFHSILMYINNTIEQDVEQLTEGGTDRMFVHLSTVFILLYQLQKSASSAAHAEQMVSEVQCAFILQMLSHSNFNKHLSAVRETFAILKRALDLGRIDQGQAMRRINSWLQQHNIVTQLLRANLHQRQYVDQVQRVLKILVAEGSLQQEHVALLWDLTEKPDTFEAVKTNVFNMLVDLAQTFNEEQLDFLFKKFEANASKSTAGNKQGMLLLFRLAKSDAQGVMTKRILGLLWRIALVPPTFSKLDMAPYFAEVLRDYAIMSRNEDTRQLALAFVSQLWDELTNGDKAVPAMRVLNILIAVPSPQYEVFMQVLQQDGDILQTILQSLQSFMSTSRHLLNAKQQSAGSWGRVHEDAVCSYSHFLLNVAEHQHTQMSWDFIQGLWDTLVEHAVLQSDRNAAFVWFANIVHETEPPRAWHLISRENGQRLLTEKIAKLDPACMSRHAYECFAAYFRQAGGAATQQSSAEPELDLPGVDFLWSIAMDTPCDKLGATAANEGLVCTAQEVLITLYSRPDPASPSSRPLCAQFVRLCVTHLQAAAEHLSGAGAPRQLEVTDSAGSMEVDAPKGSGDHSLSAQRAARCTRLLLDIIRSCQGRTMPSKPAHAASHSSMPVKIHVTHPNHSVKHYLSMSSNNYVGQLRQEVVALPTFGATPEKLRMFIGGKELLSDALLLHEAGLSQEQCVVHAMPVPVANSYSSPDPATLQATEAASPALLLSSKHSSMFPVLLALTDCSLPMVRASAKQLLDCLPTFSQVLGHLTAALQGSDPAAEMRKLLHVRHSSEAVPSTPGQLLYTLQALSSLLHPQHGTLQLDEATATTPDAAALQETVLRPDVTDVILSAVQLAGQADTSDVTTVRSLYMTTHELAKGLVSALHQQQAATSASSPSVNQLARPASAMSASPMSVQTAETGSSDVSMGLKPQLVPVSHQAQLADTDSQPTLSNQQDSSVKQDAAEDAAAPSQVDADAKIAEPSSNAAEGSSIALKLLMFFLHEALQAAQGWGAMTPGLSQVFDDVNDLPDADFCIVTAACESMHKMLAHSPGLLQPFLQCPGSRELVGSALLNCHHEGVRTLSGQFLLGVARLHSAAYHWLLQLLTDSLALADSKYACCGDFYLVFANAIKDFSRQPPEVQQAERFLAAGLLTSLTALLPRLTTLNEHDHRMQGKLELVLQLITALGNHALPSTNSQHLVHLLLTDYLFPEAYVQFMHPVLRQIPPVQLRAALLPRCNTKAGRDAALRLLRKLVLRDPANLKLSLRLIKQLHLKHDEPPVHDLLPHQSIRPVNSFVGLKNGGATCYMNAVMQQLFMQPSIRKLLLAVPEVGPPEDNADNVFYQMQNMFANLALSNKEFHVPRAFWGAFKEYDGTRLNLREHQDAYEFFTRLQDTVDQCLRDRTLPPVMQAVIGGKFAQQIICRGVPYRSEKEEDFYQLSLDVRGKRTLEESLDLYVQGELMEGDNQYLCEEANKKVDAVKRSCIKTLPHTLVIHLKRFEFDYETMTRWKIKDRFEFPQQLNMYKYTVEGLAEADKADSPSPSPGPSPSSSTPQSPPPAQCHYDYQLKGIVVHSGTAFAGHYYSFIKVRAGDDFAGSTDQWYCFDDVNVDPWEVSNVDKDCFGGKYSLDLPHYKGGPQEFEKPNSAYMLFYERAGSAEPDATAAVAAAPGTPQASAAASPSAQMAQQSAEAAAVAQAEPAPAKCDEPMLPASPLPSQAASPAAAATPNVLAQLANVSPLKGVSSLDLGQDAAKEAGPPQSVQPDMTVDMQSCATVALPARMPKPIFEGVLQSNLQLLKTSHLLDAAYFQFVMAVVQASSEMCSHKIRRTGTAEEAEQGSVGSNSGPRPAGSSRRAQDADSVALLAVNVALAFLFKIFTQVNVGRESLADWRSILQNIMESSSAATTVVLIFLSDQSMALLEEALICAQEDVREFTAGVILDAFNSAVNNHGGAYDPDSVDVDGGEGGELSEAVGAMIMAFQQAAYEVLTNQKALQHANFTQYMQTLKTYGLMGPMQRQHLASVLALPDIASQVADAVTENRAEYQLIDLLAPLSFLGLLFRQADLAGTGLSPGRSSRDSPYRLPEDAGYSVHAISREFSWSDAFAAMCKPELITDPCIVKGLQHLMWENSDMSMLIIRLAQNVWRRSEAGALFTTALAYAEVMTVSDIFQDRRGLLFLTQGSAGAGEESLGLLTIVQTRNTRQPWRRCAVYRVIIQFFKSQPNLAPEMLPKMVECAPDLLSVAAIQHCWSSIQEDQHRVPKRTMDDVRDCLSYILRLLEECIEGD